MAIFSNNKFAPVIEQVEDNSVDMYPAIEGTVECGFEIAAEGYSEVHKLVSSMYITDILIENAAMNGEDAQVLIEGALKEFKNKAVNNFKRICAQIKNWFKKMIDRLKVRLTSSKEFVNKYRDAIRAKAKNSQGYKVTRHKFKHDIDATYKAYVKAIGDYAEKANTAAAASKEDFVEKMIGAANSKSKTFSELKQSIVDKHVGKEVTNTTITSDVGTMIEWCDNSNVAIAQLENIRDEGVHRIEGFIRKIEGNGEDSSAVHAAVNNFNTATSMIQQLNTTCAKIVNDIVTEYIALLRGLMLYKPAKESFTPDEELMEKTPGQSIFESALNMF